MAESGTIYSVVLGWIRTWKIIVACGIVAATGAFAFSYLTPEVYQATAFVAVTRPAVAYGDLGLGLTVDDLPDSAAIESLAVSDATLGRLVEEFASESNPGLRDAQHMRAHLDATTINVVVRLRVELTDPALASSVANAWAKLTVDQVNGIYGLPSARSAQAAARSSMALTRLTNAQSDLATFESEDRSAILDLRFTQAQNSYARQLQELNSRQATLDAIHVLASSLQQLPPGAETDPRDSLSVLQLSSRVFAPESNVAADPLGVGVSQSSPALASAAVVGTFQETNSQAIAYLDRLGTMQEQHVENLQGSLTTLETEMLGLQSNISAESQQKSELQSAVDAAKETYDAVVRQASLANSQADAGISVARILSSASVPSSSIPGFVLVKTVAGGGAGIALGLLGVAVMLWWQEEAPLDPLAHVDHVSSGDGS